MPGQVRVGDLCICGKGAIGVYVQGSPNVLTNNRQSVRVGDMYV